MVALRADTDGATSTILPATFAELLRSGDLDRHLRRSRRVYRVRRDAVVAAVHRWLPQATVSGIAAGFDCRADASRRARRAGAGRAGGGARRAGCIARRWFAADPAGARPGLVLGYGTVPPEAAEQGVRLLADAVRAITGRLQAPVARAYTWSTARLPAPVPSCLPH